MWNKVNGWVKWGYSCIHGKGKWRSLLILTRANSPRWRFLGDISLTEVVLISGRWERKINEVRSIIELYIMFFLMKDDNSTFLWRNVSLQIAGVFFSHSFTWWLTMMLLLFLIFSLYMTSSHQLNSGRGQKEIWVKKKNIR